MLRAWTEIEGNFAEAPLRGSDHQELAIETGMGVVGQDARGKMRAMPPEQQDAAVSAAQQGGVTAPVDRHLDRVEPAHGLLGQFARLRLVADAQVAAQAELPRKPRQREDRDQRAAQAQEQVEVHRATICHVAGALSRRAHLQIGALPLDPIAG